MSPRPTHGRYAVTLLLPYEQAIELRNLFGGEVPTTSQIGGLCEGLLQRELASCRVLASTQCWCISYCATNHNAGYCACGCHVQQPKLEEVPRG